jgi:hypothetical protein
MVTKYYRAVEQSGYTADQRLNMLKKLAQRKAMNEITFDQVWDCIEYWKNKRFIGPKLPVESWRLAAALLFERYNDRSFRILKTNKEYHVYQCPCIEISWYADFSGCIGYVKILVSDEVVEKLIADSIVTNYSTRIYGDYNSLGLSSYGKKLVVTDIIKDQSFSDVFKAGAKYDLTDGTIKW